MNITEFDLVKEIAKDYNLDYNQEIRTCFNEFPIINGKRKIHSFYDAIIVDKNGNKYPYMLTNTKRNEDKLQDFDYIYIIRQKPLTKIIEECNVSLKKEKCRICEGGGWYSNSYRYFYKNFYCEI